MNLIKNIVIAVLSVTTVFFGYYALNNAQLFEGTGPLHLQRDSFLQGLTIGQGNTAITKYNCGSKSWSPAQSVVGNASTASTTISVSGAVVGDIVLASFDSATTTGLWYLAANVSGTGTSTVWIRTASSTALGTTYTTSTLKACIFH